MLSSLRHRRVLRPRIGAVVSFHGSFSRSPDRNQIVSQIVSLRARVSSAVCGCRLGRQQQRFHGFSCEVGLRIQNTSKPCKGIPAMLWSTGFTAPKASQTSAYLHSVQIYAARFARKQARANGISHRRFVVSLHTDPPETQLTVAFGHSQNLSGSQPSVCFRCLHADGQTLHLGLDVVGESARVYSGFATTFGCRIMTRWAKPIKRL